MKLIIFQSALAKNYESHMLSSKHYIDNRAISLVITIMIVDHFSGYLEK